MPLLALLRRPEVARLLLATTAGRLPLGMVPLALVLFARGAGLDFGAAGSLAAAWSVGFAVGTPVLSRTADRRGPAGVLVLSGIASGVTLCLLPGVVENLTVSVLLAAAAGATTPPLEPALRMLWPTLVEPHELEQAFALDAALQEVVFVVGPVLVAVAVRARPDAALLTAGALVLAGTLWTAAMATVRARGGAEATTRHWTGPLRAPGLLTVYAGIVTVGALVGTLPVVGAAFQEVRGVPGLAALLVGANAFGALVGGVGIALRPALVPRRVPVQLRLPLLVGVLAVTYLPLAAAGSADGSQVLLVAAAVLSGLALPALLTACYVDVDRRAPSGTEAEAFGWIITAFVLGSAAGAALAGGLARQGRPALTLVLGSCLVALAALLHGARARRESVLAPREQA
jgi:predicted MFS family arabinose efflux permease